MGTRGQGSLLTVSVALGTEGCPGWASDLTDVTAGQGGRQGQRLCHEEATRSGSHSPVLGVLGFPASARLAATLGPRPAALGAAGQVHLRCHSPRLVAAGQPGSSGRRLGSADGRAAVPRRPPSACGRRAEPGQEGAEAGAPGGRQGVSAARSPASSPAAAAPRTSWAHLEVFDLTECRFTLQK